MKRKWKLILFVVFIQASAHSSANTCESDNALNLWGNLNEYITSECATINNSIYDEYLNIYNKLENSKPLTQDVVTNNVVVVIDSYILLLEEKNLLFNDEVSRSEIKRLITTLNAGKQELLLNNLTSETINSNNTKYWLISYWDNKNKNIDSNWHYYKKSLVQDGCHVLNPSQSQKYITCSKRYEELKLLLPLMAIMKTTTQYYLNNEITEKMKRDARVEREFESYLFDGLFQYPWEQTLNFCLEADKDYPEDEQGGFWSDARCHVPFYSIVEARHKRASKGADIGWRSAPTSRRIVFHPTIGFGYTDKQPDGQRFKPSLIMQWYGVSWWDGYDSQGKMRKQKSLSFVSSFTDMVGVSNVGYGGMFYYGNYNIAITYHGDSNVQLFVGFDLMSAFDDIDSKQETINKYIN